MAASRHMNPYTLARPSGVESSGMRQRELEQRVVGFILVVMSFLVGCTIFEAAPTSTRTITLTPTDMLASTNTPTSAPAPTPTNVPPLTNTPDPCTGWWCTVRGVVYVDTIDSGNELESASVKLGQSSYCSPTHGQYQTTTGPDGAFEFSEVFFHDTDRIWIQVESEGYESTRWDSTDFYCLYCSCFGSPIEIVVHTAPGP